MGTNHRNERSGRYGSSYLLEWQAAFVSWSQLLSLTNHIADYGESHYVGPIKGAQPNSQAWVDGFSHEPWLQLNSYFAFAFKNGHYPKVHHDKIFVWGRPHPKAANASHDSVPCPDNWELVGFSTFDGT